MNITPDLRPFYPPSSRIDEAGRWILTSGAIVACHLPALPPTHRQYIYVIRRREAHEVKIGIAKRPWERLATFQIAHAVPLELALAFPGFEQEEFAVHQRFAAHRKMGEWFHAADEIETWIADEATRWKGEPGVDVLVISGYPRPAY